MIPSLIQVWTCSLRQVLLRLFHHASTQAEFRNNPRLLCELYQRVFVVAKQGMQNVCAPLHCQYYTVAWGTIGHPSQGSAPFCCPISPLCCILSKGIDHTPQVLSSRLWPQIDKFKEGLGEAFATLATIAAWYQNRDTFVGAALIICASADEFICELVDRKDPGGLCRVCTGHCC